MYGTEVATPSKTHRHQYSRVLAPFVASVPTPVPDSTAPSPGGGGVFGRMRATPGSSLSAGDLEVRVGDLASDRASLGAVGGLRPLDDREGGRERGAVEAEKGLAAIGRRR